MQLSTEKRRRTNENIRRSQRYPSARRVIDITDARLRKRIFIKAERIPAVAVAPKKAMTGIDAARANGA